MHGERKSSQIALGVSLALHAVLALLLVLAPASFPRTADFLPSQEITIEVEEVEPEHLEVVEETLPEPEVVTPAPTITPRQVEPTPTGAVIVPTPGPEVAITPEPLIEPPTVEEHPVEPQHEITSEEMHVMLDPRHVGAGIAFQDGRGPSQPGPPAGLHPEGRGDHGPTAEEAVAQTEAFLGAQASAKTYLSHTRPHVVHRPDGTYHYAGHAFEAIIQPDGSVTFNDHPDARFDGFSTSGSFDATDMFMHAAGQDPYAAEREWFMEETESIRERLEDEARAGAAVTSLRRLRGRLRSIWQDETESPSHRRRMIFQLWDESSEDDDGTAARQAVIDFVRETLPQAGPDAYPADELARLNASRESTLRFNPY